LGAKKISGGVVDPNDLRVCMDFRVVNSHTREPTYYVPLVADCHARAAGFTYGTELDLASAYHQLKINPASQEVTAFTAPDARRFMWSDMFFGPKGAMTHFQRQIDITLEPVSDLAFAYLDNIYIFT